MEGVYDEKSKKNDGESTRRTINGYFSDGMHR